VVPIGFVSHKRPLAGFEVGSSDDQPLLLNTCHFQLETRLPIGFVFPYAFAGPIRHNPLLLKDLPSLCPCRKLGLFRTISPPTDYRLQTTASATWLCFVRWLLVGRASPLAETGFVCTDVAGWRGRRTCHGPCSLATSNLKLAFRLALFFRTLLPVQFVITIFLRRIYRRSARAWDWLCFAHFASLRSRRSAPISGHPAKLALFGAALFQPTTDSRERRSPDRHRSGNWLCSYNCPPSTGN